jgi:hypothetical protein
MIAAALSIFLAVQLCALVFLLALLISARREIPPFHTSVRIWRNPGESDSDMADRLLNASPYHQAELKETK